MISSINSYSARTQIRQNQQRKAENSPLKQNSSPSFKGGMGLLSYFLVDFVAIFTSCSAEAGMFRRVDLNREHKFGMRYIKRKHPEQFKEISTLAGQIHQGLSQDPLTAKLAKKLKKTYEKKFLTPLKLDHKAQKPEEKLQTQLDTLYDKVDSLFIEMNNVPRDTAIGTPMLKMIQKTSEDLAKIEARNVPVKSTATRQKSIVRSKPNGLFPSPSVPRSQHP